MKTKWHHNSKRTINTLNRENWCENKINSKLSRTTQNEPTTKPSIFNRIKLIYWNLYLFRIDHHTHSLPSIGVYLHWLRIQFRYAWMRHNDWEKEKMKWRFVICKRAHSKEFQIQYERLAEEIHLFMLPTNRKDTTNLLCCVENPYNASLWPYFIRTFILYFILHKYCFFFVDRFCVPSSSAERTSGQTHRQPHTHFQSRHTQTYWIKWNALAPRNTKFALSKKHLLMYF